MSIFITGDQHGDFNGLLTFADKMKLGNNDYIIVLGDMGLFWRKDKKDVNTFVPYFETNYNFNLYFIDRQPRGV